MTDPADKRAGITVMGTSLNDALLDEINALPGEDRAVMCDKVRDALTDAPLFRMSSPEPADEQTFCFVVGDMASLSIAEIWPNGDAPDNPTVDDVLAVVREQGPDRMKHDWGFGFHVDVDGWTAF